MLSTDAILAATAKIPGRVDPLEKFGVEWTHIGVHKRYSHEMDLWVADATSEAYRVAWKRERDASIEAGFSWTDKARTADEPFARPCWWRMSNPALDLPAWQAAVDRALAAEAEVLAKREADRIRREAEEDARIGDRVVVIRARLAALLEKDAWQLGKQANDAREHLDAGGRRSEANNRGWSRGCYEPPVS